jgi:CRISPR-associated exonuclease Cas4
MDTTDSQPNDRNTGEVIEVLISAIEHYSYCPRQCGLIHVDQVYLENVYTVRGIHAHERVDSGERSSSENVTSRRNVPLWSDRLHLRGKADLVEFRAEGPYPVEHKVGKRRGRHPDLQLCAQALCLEEMLGVVVPRGAVFYHAVRRRREVVFDDALRAMTVATIEAIRDMLRRQTLPGAVFDARCRRCSLMPVCLPEVLTDTNRLRGLQGALFTPYDPGATRSDDV